MIKYHWQLRDVSNNNSNNNTRKKVDLVTKCCRSFINNLRKDLSNKNSENEPNNFRLELLEQIYYVVDKYLMSVSLSKKPGKLTSNLLSSMEDVRFLTQLYASGCTESWNKDKDLEAVSNRSISLILQNKKIRNK